jgi:hypothetical protein
LAADPDEDQEAAVSTALEQLIDPEREARID